MILKSVEIENFRSYYKKNIFNFSDGLNLIIGSNGDGKTTFFEALEWLFRTDVVKSEPTYISKKRSEELLSGDSDQVMVSARYEHNGNLKILEKKFKFNRTYTGELSLSGCEFSLICQNGVETDIQPGVRFEYDLPAELRKYSMFKGETNLDIFQHSNALKLLVDSFSDVKDFDSYFSFMEYATQKAEQARVNAQKSDRKNSQQIELYTSQINILRAELAKKRKELSTNENEVTNFTSYLRNLEQSQEASKLLIAVNNRIESLQKKRTTILASINEDYTINLLDEMWVLMDFKDVANEYTEIISAADKERRRLENENQQRIGVKKLLSQAEKTKFIPLPAHVPGPQIMQEMLDEEVCKVCGRPAPKDSDAWNFMLAKLNEYKDSLKVEDDEDESIYENNYIQELQKRDTILNDNMSLITRMRSRIEDIIALHNRLHEDVKKIESNLEEQYEQKKKILAQTDGLTEEQLTANYQNITNWMEKKSSAERNIEVLKKQIATITASLAEYEEKLAAIAKGTSAELYTNIWFVLRNIMEAFKNAKEMNKKRLLLSIEDEANSYLEQLNVDDFKGTIRIIPKQQGNAEVFLVDNDSARIYTPNTALKTTQFMSILFAISKLSTLKKEKKYPLIFDAPTSSFTTTKESEFFNVISKLDKQVIIVTKSFLKDGPNGEDHLDLERIREINGTVYRIEKKRPFDDKKLSTIQTIITKI